MRKTHREALATLGITVEEYVVTVKPEGWHELTLIWGLEFKHESGAILGVIEQHHNKLRTFHVRSERSWSVGETTDSPPALSTHKTQREAMGALIRLRFSGNG